MNPTVELFSQGEEVVTGQVADTNAAWLSQQLVALGFTVTRHTAVGDKLNDLIRLLKEIATRDIDCCLCTGGLGPTSDDLTAQAVAQAFDLPLQFDETAFAAIQAFFQRRGLAMPELNRKQAFLPRGAMRINNDFGTAPGFCLTYEGCFFVFLPGVPYEMQQLFTRLVKTELQARFYLAPPRLVTIKTWGLGESQLQEAISTIPLPKTVELGFRATLAENQIKLLFPNDYYLEEADELVQKMVAKLGAAVFAVDGLGETVDDLLSVVAALVSEQQLTVALLETVSCGFLAALCVGQDWLLEASYQRKWMALTESQLLSHALLLGQAIRAKSGANIAVVQLYAGEANAFFHPEQPLTLYNVVITADGFCQQVKTVTGLPQRKQQHAAYASLDLLRRFLQHHETLCPY